MIFIPFRSGIITTTSRAFGPRHRILFAIYSFLLGHAVGDNPCANAQGYIVFLGALYTKTEPIVCLKEPAIEYKVNYKVQGPYNGTRGTMGRE
jgi:hypothetical protein